MILYFSQYDLGWKSFISAFKMCFHSQFLLYGSTFPCPCFPPAPPFYLLYPMQGFDFSTSMDYKQSILPGIQKLADNSPETYKLTAAGLLAWGRWKENLRAAKNHTQPGLWSQPEDRRDSETASRAGSQSVRRSTGLQSAPATCHGLLVRFECSLVDRRINPETNSSPSLSIHLAVCGMESAIPTGLCWMSGQGLLDFTSFMGHSSHCEGSTCRSFSSLCSKKEGQIGMKTGE